MRIEPKQAFYNEDTGAVQPWKDIEVTDTVGNALVAEGLVTEIEGGGGGDSDFSTAEVTIVIPWEFSEFSVEDCPTIQDDMSCGWFYVETSPAIVTVPLYKGKCYWAWSNSAVTITSGSAEPQGDGILITGNCTLTAED